MESPRPPTMRNHWFEYVAKVRKKLTRERKEPVSHREAMREASVTWVTEKEKVKRKLAKLARNIAKQ